MISQVLTDVVLAQQPSPGMPIPNPPAQLPPGLEEPASRVLGWLKGGLLLVVFGSLLWAGIQISAGFRNRRQTSQEGVMGVGWALLALAVGGAAFALAQSLPV